MKKNPEHNDFSDTGSWFGGVGMEELPEMRWVYCNLYRWELL